MTIRDDEPSDRRGPESDVERGAGTGPEGNSGQRADMAVEALTPAAEDPSHPDREDERLEEGLEETFPASDPVSAKHIT